MLDPLNTHNHFMLLTQHLDGSSKFLYMGDTTHVHKRSRSENTPPAVTSAPAPGPRMMRGCFMYREVEKRMMLSLPVSWANAWFLGYLLSSTLASFVVVSTTPT